MTEQWSEKTRKLVGATVGRGLDDAQLALLEHVSVTKNLDPLAGELIGYAQGGKLTLITTINGMTKLCAQSLDGVDVIFFDTQGNEFSVWLPDIAPAACAVSVWRKGCARAFTASCRFNDYQGNGQPWKRMPSTMIRKCALAAALRLGFADLLAGLYAQEEMEQAGFTSSPQAGHYSETDPEPQPARPTKPPTPRRTPSVRTVDHAASSLANATGGSVLEQIRDDTPQILPERDWAPHENNIQSLWNVCRGLGMTAEGWSTLELQLGTITPVVARQIATQITADKVERLNSGRSTTGAPLPVTV